MRKNKIGFSLVEVVVMVTILAVITSIGYFSYVGYGVSARDSVRLSDVKTINSGLSHFQIRTGKVPKSHLSTAIKVGGEIIHYQSNLGPEITGMIGASKTVDPKTKEMYTYVSDRNSMNYQVGAFLEIDDPNYALISSTYANDQSEKIFYSQGKRLGIIEMNNGDLVHKILSNFNIEDALGNIKGYFGRNDVFIGTADELIDKIN